MLKDGVRGREWDRDGGREQGSMLWGCSRVVTLVSGWPAWENSDILHVMQTLQCMYVHFVCLFVHATPILPLAQSVHLQVYLFNKLNYSVIEVKLTLSS